MADQEAQAVPPPERTYQLTQAQISELLVEAVKKAQFEGQARTYAQAAADVQRSQAAPTLEEPAAASLMEDREPLKSLLFRDFAQACLTASAPQNRPKMTAAEQEAYAAKAQAPIYMHQAVQPQHNTPKGDRSLPKEPSQVYPSSAFIEMAPQTKETISGQLGLPTVSVSENFFSKVKVTQELAVIRYFLKLGRTEEALSLLDIMALSNEMTLAQMTYGYVSNGSRKTNLLEGSGNHTTFAHRVLGAFNEQSFFTALAAKKKADKVKKELKQAASLSLQSDKKRANKKSKRVESEEEEEEDSSEEEEEPVARKFPKNKNSNNKKDNKPFPKDRRGSGGAPKKKDK